MNKLKELRGEKSYEAVSTIMETATAVTVADNFGKVITPMGEYYYLLSQEDEMALTPDKFKVVHSSKHKCEFIMPVTNSGFSAF